MTRVPELCCHYQTTTARTTSTLTLPPTEKAKPHSNMAMWCHFTAGHPSVPSMGSCSKSPVLWKSVEGFEE